MKASIYTQYGTPSKVLQYKEVEKPVPAKDEILVKVHASTANRTDLAALTADPWIMRLFKGLLKPKDPILGTDFAGTVVDTGEAVDNVSVNDRIFGFNDNGLNAHAEYLTINKNKPFAPIPEQCDFVQAAASIEGGHYACNFIKKAELTPNKNVMVYGATGAIGSALLQILKDKGVFVTAVCNTKNVELIKSIGADKVVDYQTEDYTKDDLKYHYIFDAVGKISFGKCKHMLHPKGIYMSSELGKGLQNIWLALFTPLTSALHLYKKKTVYFPVPTNIPASIQKISNLLARKKFNPIIDRTYPLSKTGEAFDYVNSCTKTGNVVIINEEIE